MTTTEAVPYLPERASRIRTVLVLYRKPVKGTPKIEASGDTWMFLSLKNAHYGICGYAIDMIMLMDGITKEELYREPAWLTLRVNLKPDGAVMEAG